MPSIVTLFDPEMSKYGFCQKSVPSVTPIFRLPECLPMLYFFPNLVCTCERTFIQLKYPKAVPEI